MELTILELSASENDLTAKISDGRTVSISTSQFPKLREATPQQLQNFELSPSRCGIHWPDLDEDISIEAFK